MRTQNPEDLHKLLEINTLEELNDYYRLANEYYQTQYILPIDISSFTCFIPTITEDEVNAAICKLGAPTDPQTDIQAIVNIITNTRKAETVMLKKIYDSTSEPRSQKAPHGKKGHFIGDESGWHIHLVKDDDHLKNNTDYGTRKNLHTNGGRAYKPEDLWDAANSLLAYIQQDSNAWDCYVWLWRRLYEQKSDLIRKLPPPERKK